MKKTFFAILVVSVLTSIAFSVFAEEKEETVVKETSDGYVISVIMTKSKIKVLPLPSGIDLSEKDLIAVSSGKSVINEKKSSRLVGFWPPLEQVTTTKINVAFIDGKWKIEELDKVDEQEFINIPFAILISIAFLSILVFSYFTVILNKRKFLLPFYGLLFVEASISTGVDKFPILTFVGIILVIIAYAIIVMNIFTDPDTGSTKNIGFFAGIGALACVAIMSFIIGLFINNIVITKEYLSLLALIMVISFVLAEIFLRIRRPKEAICS